MIARFSAARPSRTRVSFTTMRRRHFRASSVPRAERGRTVAARALAGSELAGLGDGIGNWRTDPPPGPRACDLTMRKVIYIYHATLAAIVLPGHGQWLPERLQEGTDRRGPERDAGGFASGRVRRVRLASGGVGAGPGVCLREDQPPSGCCDGHPYSRCGPRIIWQIQGSSRSRP